MAFKLEDVLRSIIIDANSKIDPSIEVRLIKKYIEKVREARDGELGRA